MKGFLIPRCLKSVFLSFLSPNTLVLLCVLLLGLSHSAPASEQTELLKARAQRYYYGQGAKKDLNQAFRLYLQAAELGDVDAMFIVGGLYMKGQGTSINENEAFKWLYNAALKGRSSRESQRILGQFFLAGQSVPQNYAEALRWFELAANGGDPEAQTELAYLYFTGEQVEKDLNKAYHWFKRAAEKGYSLAQYNLGILWYTGNGVPEADPVQAYAWFSLAASNGHGNGEVAKKFMENQLSEEELRRAQELSVQLYMETQ